MARKNYDINEDALKDYLGNILREIHEDEDPAELDEYRRLFNKHTSIFKRGYVAAYMLKYADAQKSGPGSKRKSNRNRPVESRNKDNSREPQSETSEDMVSVFIGIGRTRRVYPRDLVGLILDSTKLERSDIGNIKILDNYSFADIHRAKADDVIQLLNGVEFRGRSLNVNYAKKKS